MRLLNESYYLCQMKLFCFILSVYVVMLSAMPCCTDTDCQIKATAKKELAGKSSQKEKACQGCSPFFTCGTCMGFILSKPFTPNLKPIAETPEKMFVVYQQPYVQQVSLSIWQPPQIG
jgi:hypothetical protein